jgi:hypothetical protein
MPLKRDIAFIPMGIPAYYSEIPLYKPSSVGYNQGTFTTWEKIIIKNGMVI